jgi:hypothetical protein
MCINADPRPVTHGPAADPAPSCPQAAPFADLGEDNSIG